MAAAAGALSLPASRVAGQSIAVNLETSPTITFPPGAIYVMPVIVDLSAAGSVTLASLQGGLTWNAALMRLDSMPKVGGTGWTLNVNMANAASGAITFSGSRSGAQPSTFALANAFFTIGANAGGTRVIMTPTAAGNATGQNVLGAIRPRGLDLCVSSPGGGLWGDVNNDATVDISDAQQILRFSVGLSVVNPGALAQRGDVTNDAVVDIGDAQQILRFSVGLSAAARINTTSNFASIPPNAMTMSPNSTQFISTGASAQFQATPLSGATDLSGCAPITWLSSTPSVAVVNASGFVTGVNAGSANIIATSGVATAQVTVNVAPAPVASVAVTLGSASIGLGGPTTATATLRDVSNNVLTGRVVTWSSSNPAVATVNSATGAVTGVALGTANIIATSEGVQGQATVSVVTVPVATVSVSLGSASILSASTTQATATTRDASNNILVGRLVTWSSSNSLIATVNAATGLVTAIAPGTVNIIATSEGKTGQTSLQVNALPVATVNVTVALPSIRATSPIASTTTANAVLKDALGNLLTGRVITWSSSNTAKATVNSATGVVTGVAPGIADITATSEGVSALATITVTSPPVATVSVAVANPLSVGASTTAIATPKDSLGNALVGRVVSFSSSNSAIASINAASGLANGLANGTVSITATSEGKAGVAALTVSAAASEPFYVPGAGVTLVMSDNIDRYTDAISMGAFPYKYTGPMITPVPAPSQTSQPVDTAHVKLVSPGRGGTGNALRLLYDGVYQESHNWATINLPSQPNNQTVYIQYYARITPATNWPLTQALAVKWMMAWHNISQSTRMEWNTRYPSSSDTKETAPTVWQVVDQGESPTNGDQPFGPFFHQVADGQWHRFTHAFKPHTSSTIRDGFSKMWVDGTMIIDIEKANVGVVPPGGVAAWCSQLDVDNMTTADGIAFLKIGGPQTTTTGAWIYDLDDLVWWRQ